MFSGTTALKLEIEHIEKRLNNQENMEVVFQYLDELLEKNIGGTITTILAVLYEEMQNIGYRRSNSLRGRLSTMQSGFQRTLCSILSTEESGL